MGAGLSGCNKIYCMGKNLFLIKKCQDQVAIGGSLYFWVLLFLKNRNIHITLFRFELPTILPHLLESWDYSCVQHPALRFGFDVFMRERDLDAI